MKKLLLAVLLSSSCFAGFCLEPVGYSLQFNLVSKLRAEAASNREVVAFSGSTFVKVHLKDLDLGEGDKLVISDGKRDYGTIAGPSNGERWLPSVPSEAAYLDLERGENASSPSYVIDEVGVGIASIGPAIESICGLDDRKNALCYSAEKQAAGDAVGRMLFQSGGAWYLCTGSLVSQNGHFLTNNHCIEDQYGASSMEVWWRYQASSCAGTDSNYEYSTTGSTFLTTDANLDFTLLKLTDASPSQRYGYLQIANRLPVTGETIWIPQHGGGTIKRFAVESDMDAGGIATVVIDSIKGNIPNSDIGYYADTEGGASGSPVLDANNKILALHHFGLPSGYSCDSSYMNQGVKMMLIYPKIASYLDAPVPPVVNSVSKAANPFRLIFQGSNFSSGIDAYIGSDVGPWPKLSYKSSSKFILKGGDSLKQKFPKGTPVQIKLVNDDGATSYVTYTR
jgi:lysyl endopeptidase